MSRLDYWLVTDTILNHMYNCEISPSPLTDHCGVNLAIIPADHSSRKKGYWKFNASLLKYEDYCNGVKNLINEIAQDNNIISYTQKWEFLKYKIRQYSISFGKSIKNTKNLEEDQIIKEIHDITNNRLTENDKIKLYTLQNKLDKIYERKAKGAYIRSRSKWIEEGEKNSAYFCRLEKKNVKRKIQLKLLLSMALNATTQN